MKPDDAERLNLLVNLKVTLLFTYSGITDQRIEPYPSAVAAGLLELISAFKPRRYRTVLYWRPLVPGLNDSDEHLDRARELHKHADATVFTGLFRPAAVSSRRCARGYVALTARAAGLAPIAAGPRRNAEGRRYATRKMLLIAESSPASAS